jgi:hypothetical protein
MHVRVHVLFDVTDGCLKEVVGETTERACGGQLLANFRDFCVPRIAPTTPWWRSSVPALVRRTASARVRSPSSKRNTSMCHVAVRPIVTPLATSMSLTVPEDGAIAQRRKTRPGGSNGTAGKPRHVIERIALGVWLLWLAVPAIVLIRGDRTSMSGAPESAASVDTTVGSQRSAR